MILYIRGVTIAVFDRIQAQTIIVNPDGTHSIIIDNGSTKAIVNPRETQSAVK
jgi:hypothetical protein